MAVLFPERLFDYSLEEYKEKTLPPATMWAVCSLTCHTLTFKKHNGKNYVSNSYHAIVTGGEAEGATDSKYLLGIVKLTRQQRSSFFEKILNDCSDFSFRPILFRHEKKTEKNIFLNYLKSEAERCSTKVLEYQMKDASEKLKRCRNLQMKIIALVDKGYSTVALFYEFGKVIRKYLALIRSRRRENKRKQSKDAKQVE